MSTNNGGGWDCGEFALPYLLRGEETENVAADLLGQVFVKAGGYGSPMVPKSIDTGGQFSWNDWLWIIMVVDGIVGVWGSDQEET